MRKNGGSPQSPDTSDREKHIEWCREHLPEGTTIYTIIRGNNLVESRHTLSCLIARTGEDDLPTIEIIDEQVATILGYKRKEDKNGNGAKEGFTMNGLKEMIGVTLAAALSFVIFGDHTKLRHQWL